MRKSKDVSKKITPDLKKVPKKVKDKLRPIVQKLLSKCTDTKVLTRKAEWNEMSEIFSLLEAVKDLEKDYKVAFPERKENWQRFYDWCSENGAKFTSVKIEEIADGNFGMKATKPLQEGESFLTVPRKLMMSELSAKNSKLNLLISNSPVLQHMPNVLVSMHLLTEVLDPNSFWGPYISILPSTYTTVLYFTFEEIKELEKSPVIDEVFTIIRSVARQYCYFFQVLEKCSSAKSLNIAPYFTFDLYRWAVSSVMTRQNIVPSSDGQEAITSLVPLFDMCNHTNGKLSSDFNLDSDCLVSYSFKSFAEGEEVFMFYGSRTNAEFIVHNGFVYPENENDSLEIKFGISKNDPLHAQKCELCSRLKVSINGPFYLFKDKVISEELLNFIKVYVLKSDELREVLENKEDTTETVLNNLPDLNKRAYLFLRDRMNLLLKSYGSTVEEDATKLEQNASKSIQQGLSLQLQLCEKRILNSAYNLVMKELS